MKSPDVLAPNKVYELEQLFAPPSDIEIEKVTETSTAPAASGPAIAYAQGTPMRNEIEKHGAGMLDAVTKAATTEIEAAYGTGPVSAKIQGFVVTAR